jgi:15-cis-phytoene synthase
MSNHSSEPSVNSPPISLPYDLEACTELMRGGSKSFFAASRLLPARLRPPAIALYAFCRLADDAIDEGDDPVLAMADLKSRLAAIYAGRPGAEDADRALTIVVHRYGVPSGLLEALLDGFLWDSQGRRYETLADVEAYGARVCRHCRRHDVYHHGRMLPTPPLPALASWVWPCS